MRSNAAARKEQLLGEISATRAAILGAAAALTPAQANEIFLGVWSMKDLLAHLVGWDHANLDAIQSLRSHQLPAFYVYIDKDWKTFNARLVQIYKTEDFEDLLRQVRASHQELIDHLIPIPAGEFDQDYGVAYKGCKITITRLLKWELADEKIHLSQVQTHFHA